ncbi:uncharacterized protein LOC141883796 isoform X2 [Acropora palmata]|uniref:uncharacterized protein LOC141883796 isoform X2 n=1 Tax=Acropora palmata TaxID=6131 RepID=UPI003DA07BCD
MYKQGHVLNTSPSFAMRKKPLENLNGGRTNLVEPVEPSSAQSICHNRNVVWRCPHRNISMQVGKCLVSTTGNFRAQGPN